MWEIWQARSLLQVAHKKWVFVLKLQEATVYNSFLKLQAEAIQLPDAKEIIEAVSGTKPHTHTATLPGSAPILKPTWVTVLFDRKGRGEKSTFECFQVSARKRPQAVCHLPFACVDIKWLPNPAANTGAEVWCESIWAFVQCLGWTNSIFLLQLLPGVNVPPHNKKGESAGDIHAVTEGGLNTTTQTWVSPTLPHPGHRSPLYLQPSCLPALAVKDLLSF